MDGFWDSLFFPAPDLSEPNYENIYTNTDLDKLN